MVNDEERRAIIKDAILLLRAATDILESDRHEESWRLHRAFGLAQQSTDKIRSIFKEEMTQMVFKEDK